jgi:hypothetical protein
MKRITASLACFLFLNVSRAETDPKTPPEPNQAQPALSHYCAREGETIEARIERLETALRLARAELKVNRRRK